MRPDLAARILAMIGASLLILVALMRLLSVYLLIGDPRLQSTPPELPGPDPALGMYAFSSDGQQVRFERGVFMEGVWTGDVYLLDLEDGTTTTGDLPAPSAIYSIENGQVFLDSGSPGPRLSLSPAGMQVSSGAASASGKAFAWIDSQDEGIQRLYGLRDLSPAELVMEAETIHGMHWSQDDAMLTFIAATDEGEDVFVFSFVDRTIRRLTSDGKPKGSPRISPDSGSIAFLASPFDASGGDDRQPVLTAAAFDPLGERPQLDTDVYLVEVEGANLRRLTESPQDETGLDWTASGEVAYARWHPQWNNAAYLYAIDPGNSAERRIYPPVAIEALTCQPALPGGNQASVRVRLSNESSAQTVAPLEISADRHPVDLLTNRSAFRVQRENIPLQPGETREIAWEVPIPDDLRVYLAASIEIGVEFPISASFCEVTPRRLFLPRLPLLGASMLVGALGTLVCVPWLRHNRKRGFWLLAASFWGILAGLLLLESWIVLNGGMG